jgi:hypothetical protein
VDHNPTLKILIGETEFPEETRPKKRQPISPAANLRTATTAGDSLFVNVIAFAQLAAEALLALSDATPLRCRGT